MGARRSGGTKRLIAAAMCAALITIGSAAQATDQIIVRFHAAAAKRDTVEAWAARRNTAVVRPLRLPGAYLLECRQPVASVLRDAKSDPQVLYASRARTVRPCTTVPNDPFFPQQWHLRNTGQMSGLAGADIGATEAWDVTTGSARTVIAIIDGGLELGHPDMAGRTWTNPGEIAGNGIDDDGNGYVDDVHGWNFYAHNNDVGPTLAHGTSVAGLAGAATNNGIGVAGVNWNAQLMIVNIFSPDGYGAEADACDAIVYACDNGAQIINASWGDTAYSPLLADTVAYARTCGVLICAAAGNDNVDSDEHPFYPACIGSDALIAVGGTTNRDEWVFNYGAESVHLAAPANLVYQARYPSTYGYGSGTSYATPLVAGVAGLVQGLDPSQDGRTIKFRLVGSASSITTLAGRSVTGGRLDAAAAVTAASEATTPTRPLRVQLNQVGAHGIVATLAPAADGTGDAGSFYQLKVAASVTPDNFSSLAERRTGPVPGTDGALLLIDGIEPATACDLGVLGFDGAGRAGPLTTAHFTTISPQRVFFDPCDTTSTVWDAEGFTLAGGSTHTGASSWQDSPDGDYTSGTVATLTGGPFDTRSLARPRLSFWLEYFFPVRLAEGDRLEVLASGDGGATWRTLRRFHATSSPPRRFSLPLDELGPTAALMVRFRLVTDADAYVADGVYIDDISIEEGLSDIPFTDQVIVESYDFFGDETGTPEFTRTGAWAADVGKSSAPKLSGADVLSAPAGAAGTMARFVPFLPVAGDYEIFTTHGGNANASGVVASVAYADGISSISLTQSAATANRWVSLGVFPLGYGRDPSRGAVELDASQAVGGRVFADAVRFVLVRPQQETSSVKEWLRFE
jgi:subtilisin family serine protease